MLGSSAYEHTGMDERLHDLNRSFYEYFPAGPRSGPDAALSVWVAEQQEVAEETLDFQSLLFLRHPDIQSDVWATPRKSDDFRYGS